jgi:hypothetical protein
VATLAQIVVALMRQHLPEVAYRDAAQDPLTYALVAPVAVGAFFGWRRSHPVTNVWQRGVIAVLAAIGGLLIGFMGAIADRIFGLGGLIAWGIAAAAFGLAGSRWAVQAARPPDVTPGAAGTP